MRLTVFDVETTGVDPKEDHIIEVGIVHFEDGEKVGEYQTLVDTDRHISKKITSITNINRRMINEEGKPWKAVAGAAYRELQSGDIWCAHNAPFDVAFLKKAFGAVGYEWKEKPIIDTLLQCRRFIPNRIARSKSLTNIAPFFGIQHNDAHRAARDSETTGKLLFKLIDKINSLHSKPFFDIKDLTGNKPLCLGPYNIGEDPFEALYNGLPSYHAF